MDAPEEPLPPVIYTMENKPIVTCECRSVRAAAAAAAGSPVRARRPLVPRGPAPALPAGRFLDGGVAGAVAAAGPPTPPGATSGPAGEAEPARFRASFAGPGARAARTGRRARTGPRRAPLRPPLGSRPATREHRPSRRGAGSPSGSRPARPGAAPVLAHCGWRASPCGRACVCTSAKCEVGDRAGDRQRRAGRSSPPPPPAGPGRGEPGPDPSAGAASFWALISFFFLFSLFATFVDT